MGNKAVEANYDVGDSRVQSLESLSNRSIDLSGNVGARINLELKQESIGEDVLLASLVQLGDNATKIIDAQNQAQLTTVASLAQIQEFLSGAQSALGRFVNQFALPLGLLIGAYGLGIVVRAWKGKK